MTSGSASPTEDRRPAEPEGSWVREVGPFVVLTFGTSWGLWAVCLALGGDLTDPLVLLLWGIGGLGPTLAALVLRLAGRRGARQARVRAVGRWGRQRS
jgi:hypothetical protein